MNLHQGWSGEICSSQNWMYLFCSRSWYQWSIMTLFVFGWKSFGLLTAFKWMRELQRLSMDFELDLILLGIVLMERKLVYQVFVSLSIIADAFYQHILWTLMLSSLWDKSMKLLIIFLGWLHLQLVSIFLLTFNLDPNNYHKWNVSSLLEEKKNTK